MSKKKKKKNNEPSLIKVRFSIGAKLITIISVIVLVSLGSIIALVSWLVRQDLQVAAEENNFEINRRSAAETESTLANVRSNSRMLIQTITAAGTESAVGQNAADFFFQENPQIAAIFFTARSQPDAALVNNHFFVSREIEAELAESWRGGHDVTLRRASAGETVLLNAAPHFTIPVLAFFFPWRIGGVGVLFSPAALNDSYCFGNNQSYLLNDSFDILIHSDSELVRDGANVANRDYARFLRETAARNSQTLFTDEDGARYFRAFTKLGIGGCTTVTGIEYDKVFEGIAATTRRNLYLTAAVLLISIMLIWFFAKSISVPLKALAGAARGIEGGAFEVDLKPRSRDEVGVLTASFQRMCAALGIFGRFTNRDIAVRAMRGEIRPGGLPKHATIFFSDIRGFTEKSENFTKTFGDDASDRIVRWLNEYLTSMVECVEKTNGAVDKFIGDAVMAHWGTAYTSGSPRQDAFNCVVAALMMRKALYYMNKERKQGDPGNPPIQIGCGINTGIVTAGQIGSDLRMEYTVIGDPVNLASRIEALNKPLGTDILISENTWLMVKDKIITEEMPSVTVKGKAKPLRIFAVVNFTGMEKGPRTLAEVRGLLGIKPPDISKVDVDAHEEKYSISGER
jgi:adenylate cyclase